MTSSRPAEYGFGDWQARNAACGAEFIRFRAICGHFGTNSTARTSISQPGVTLTPSPARHTWSTPSPTASPPPAPAGAPRLALSVTAPRCPADIRESSKNRRATRDASQRQLVPPGGAFGREGVPELVDAPKLVSTAEFRHFRDPRVRARSTVSRATKHAERRRGSLPGGRHRGAAHRGRARAHGRAARSHLPNSRSVFPSVAQECG